MEITHQHINGMRCQVGLKGRFTFSDNQAFRELLNNISTSSTTLELELAALEFIDSAGLGMLLLAHEMLQQRGGGIVLRTPRGQVQQMIDLSRFDRLFTVID